MMNEIKPKESSEIKTPEANKYKEIKPENGTTYSDSKQFWQEEFSGNHTEMSSNDAKEKPEFFTTKEERVERTPPEDTDKGHWEGSRGDGKFVPNENSEEGKAIKERLSEFGQDGIEFKDGVVDFSKVADTTVEIDNMTENRHNYFNSNGEKKLGNFSQADKKCAEYWNSIERDGRSDWQARDVKTWRHENAYSWHERSDMKTCDLVPRDIHNFYTHSGGCAECKRRDANIGGISNEKM